MNQHRSKFLFAINCLFFCVMLLGFYLAFIQFDVLGLFWLNSLVILPLSVLCLINSFAQSAHTVNRTFPTNICTRITRRLKAFWCTPQAKGNLAVTIVACIATFYPLAASRQPAWRMGLALCFKHYYVLVDFSYTGSVQQATVSILALLFFLFRSITHLRRFLNDNQSGYDLVRFFGLIILFGMAIPIIASTFVKVTSITTKKLDIVDKKTNIAPEFVSSYTTRNRV